jgi:hypothetical protein
LIARCAGMEALSCVACPSVDTRISSITFFFMMLCHTNGAPNSTPLSVSRILKQNAVCATHPLAGVQLQGSHLRPNTQIVATVRVFPGPSLIDADYAHVKPLPVAAVHYHIVLGAQHNPRTPEPYRFVEWSNTRSRAKVAEMPGTRCSSQANFVRRAPVVNPQFQRRTPAKALNTCSC